MGGLSPEEIKRRLAAHADGYEGGAIGKSQEWRRIKALPLEVDAAPDLTPLFLRPDVPGRCGLEDAPGVPCQLCASGSAALQPIQSAALYQAERGSGALGSIGVGHGKELTTLLLPHVFPSAGRVMLFTKARLRDQLTRIDIPRYGRHFVLPLDRLVIKSYEELSLASGTWMLERETPGLIILNEAHAVRHASSTRTKRLFRYLKAHPQTIVVALSGTIANDSPRDFQHLAAASLGNGSPVPLQWREAEDWSRALEEPSGREAPIPPGAIVDLMSEEVREHERALCDATARPWAQRRELARRVFRRRLIASPGVVATEGDSFEGAIEIYGVSWELPTVVREQLEQLQRFWRIGDEEFSDGKDIARKSRELALGFRYEWDWGEGGKDQDWIDKRSAWASVIRDVMSGRSKAGLDSPMLIAAAAARGELRPAECEAYKQWTVARERWPKGPPVRTVWLSDFAVRHAVAWLGKLTKETPGICWYEHQAFGEALREAGQIVFGAGDDGILAYRGVACCASVAAHSEGKNLQHFSRGLVVSPPANGSRWEQLIGRNARRGQLAKEIVFDVCQNNEAQCSAFAAALSDARFQQQALGQRQKLLAATKIGFR
jgi:hypothetical protein